ncbi:hypothetical protein SCYAM73S_06826 [Streptomyces cyaneofuscatus]
MGDWTAADEVHIAYGLSSWHPTAGTRTAGAVSRERRGAGRRIRYTEGRLEHRDDAPPTLEWPFPEPLGRRTVIGEFTMADVVTVPSHLAVPEVRTYMTAEAARDLSSPDTPAPAAVDERGRSDQTFLVDVVVRSGGAERRAVARGQDIYAVTAPLVVEAAERVLTGRTRAVGVASAGRMFDAPDFLGRCPRTSAWNCSPRASRLDHAGLVGEAFRCEDEHEVLSPPRRPHLTERTPNPAPQLRNSASPASNRSTSSVSLYGDSPTRRPPSSPRPRWREASRA